MVEGLFNIPKILLPLLLRLVCGPNNTFHKLNLRNGTEEARS